MNIVEEFNEYRSRMTEKILAGDNKIIKRLFNLDTNCFAEGSLTEATKEMIGWRVRWHSVKYHSGKSKELGISDEQVHEVFAIAYLIGKDCHSTLAASH